MRLPCSLFQQSRERVDRGEVGVRLPTDRREGAAGVDGHRAAEERGRVQPRTVHLVNQVMKTYRVEIEKFAQKQFRRLPAHIQKALRTWSAFIEDHGTGAMRRIPGYHDEPLRGNRQGQRSSRLSRGYRVIYVESEAGEITIVCVQEVSKHDY